MYAGAFYSSSGTYYASDEALAGQAAAVNDSAAAYPAYSAETVAQHDDAWHPTNLTAPSMYTKPGYAALVAAFGLPAQPLLYDYGGNVVVQPDAVYINGVFVGAPPAYADQASKIAASGKAAQPPADAKWVPLGVFAIVEGAATTSDDVFQLAIDAQGVIRGNYHNVKTNQMIALSGSLERQSQRAAWTIGKDQLPVYEAGIANLSKDATSILVHLPDGQSHQMTLIRLAEPQP